MTLGQDHVFRNRQRLTACLPCGIFRYMAKRQDTRPGDIVGVARALADPTRLRVLHALSKGELCVCQITELAALAPKGERRMGANPHANARSRSGISSR